MDIAEEMLSDRLSDSDDEEFSMSSKYYEGITETQRAQMTSGLENIRSIIGDGVVSDRQIREQLWETYFDTDDVASWALEQQEKDQKEKEKQKGESFPNEIPVLSRFFFSLLSLFCRFIFRRPPHLCTSHPGWTRFPLNATDTNADPTSPSNLSALQRMSLATQAKKASGSSKRSLASLALARKATSPSGGPSISSHGPFDSDTPGRSLPIQPKSLAATASTRAPQGALSTSASSLDVKAKPTATYSSLLSRKAASPRETQISKSPTSPTPTTTKPSKLAQKIKLGQAAQSRVALGESKDAIPPVRDETAHANGEKMGEVSDLFNTSPEVGSNTTPHPSFIGGNLTAQMNSPSTRLLTPSDPPPIPRPATATISVAVAQALPSTFGAVLIGGGILASSSKIHIPPTSPTNDQVFAFNSPSPDDIALSKRAGTRLAAKGAGPDSGTSKGR